MLIDTHCHLNLAEHFPDPAAAIERSSAAGVERLVVVGIDEVSNERALELASEFDEVYAVVGWHPNSAAEFDAATSRRIEEWVGHPKAVAIGEVGLDYHWDFATKDQQRRCLLDQLDLAAELNKPVVFHCREAWDDLLDLLEARGNGPYLFHCFSGDREQAARALALGGILGVDGPITYKKNHALRDMAAKWPHDRVVLETDSPYLSPEPFRGKPNGPWNLPLINNALAACWKVPTEESARLTTENALRFFRLASED